MVQIKRCKGMPICRDSTIIAIVRFGRRSQGYDLPSVYGYFIFISIWNLA